MSEKIINKSLDKKQIPIGSLIFVTLLLIGSVAFLFSRIKAEESRMNISWADIASDEYAGGTGSEQEPYLISSGSDLALLAKEVNAGIDTSNIYYELENNIDLKGGHWMPVGTDYSFKGHFDGKGNKIIGMRLLVKKGVKNYGLFGINEGEITNITISAAHVELSASDVLRGWTDLKDIKVGTICGINRGLVSNNIVTRTSINVADMSTVTIGGLAGTNESGNIVNSKIDINIATKNNKAVSAGGFIGKIVGTSSIESCKCKGSFSATAVNQERVVFAGFSGVTEGKRYSIDKCFADMTVSGNTGEETSINGFVGQNDGGKYEKCISKVYCKANGVNSFLPFSETKLNGSSQCGYYEDKTHIVLDGESLEVKTYKDRKAFFLNTLELDKNWKYSEKEYLPILRVVSAVEAE